MLQKPRLLWLQVARGTCPMAWASLLVLHPGMVPASLCWATQGLEEGGGHFGGGEDGMGWVGPERGTGPPASPNRSPSYTGLPRFAPAK